MKLERLVSVTLLLVFCLWGTTVSAQDAESQRPSAEITDKQASLNEEGVRAIIRGDQEKAVALLSESLAYGEANVTYLNLGRAYQKMGNCQEARRALRKAKRAPAVADPPPEIVDKRADEFMNELDEMCPSADSSAEQDTEPSTASDARASSDKTDQIEEPVTPPEETSNTGAWITIGSGVFVAGGGVLMHVLAQQTRNDVWNAGYVEGSNDTVYNTTQQQADDARKEANLYNTIGLSANIAGAALVGVGTYLLLSNDSSEAASLRLDVGPDRAAAIFEWTF